MGAAGVVGVAGVFLTVVGAADVVLVVFVPVVVFSSLQPITVKAASTRTADSVRIAFLIFVPPSSHYLTVCLSDAGRVRAADEHQTRFPVRKDALQVRHDCPTIWKNQALGTRKYGCPQECRQRLWTCLWAGV